MNAIEELDAKIADFQYSHSDPPGKRGAAEGRQPRQVYSVTVQFQ